MFYSDTLLAKTGPLARVWLAANLEKKLTKQNVLTSDLQENVKSIIAPGQAPMALRLSGQLLLGVVKIYSRKARYLLDDCNDALTKIKMAFRPGNVDMPSGQAHTANRDALVLPDAISELDLFAPLPDPEQLLRDDYDRRGPDPTLLPDFGSSALLSDSQTPRREKRTMDLHDFDLDLDIGEGIGSTTLDGERSIEIGRRAPTPRRDEPSFFDDPIEGLDIGLDDDTTIQANGFMMPPDDDLPMPDADQNGGMTNADIEAANAKALARADNAAEAGRRERQSESPLSPLGASQVRDLNTTFQLDPEEVEDETMQQAAQRVKRRKVLQQDSETQLHNSQIKKQQEDRSAITKAPTFLPRDPLLLQLMEMQRSGNFVSNIMGDGRMAGWAPELRGILSLEVVRKAGERKRKRDSGVADLDDDDEQATPGIQIPEDNDDSHVGGGAGAFLPSDAAAPMSDPLAQPEEDDLYPDSPGAAFNITEAPLLHPSQSGPVSLGTKTAVHALREYFAPDHPKTLHEPPTPSKRVKAEAMFTDLCPEQSTSRNDATKMFFELLVLGTKDAVKVEQDSKEGVGGKIRVRGKRGLWGDWAEMGSTQTADEEAQVQEV